MEDSFPITFGTDEVEPLMFDRQKMLDMPISQSALKDFADWNECKIRWYRKFVLKEKYPPTQAMLQGLLFEDKVIGGTRDGDIPEIPTTAKGDYYKWYLDLEKSIGIAKKTMNQLKIEPLVVQPEIHFEGEIAHFDLLCNFKHNLHMSEYDDPLCIMDIKWTDTRKDDKWKGWHDIGARKLLHVQPIHYIRTYFRKHGVMLPFYYLIFGKITKDNPRGWKKIIRVKVRQDSFMAHEVAINKMRHELKTFVPTPSEDGDVCEKCNFYDTCSLRAELPLFEEVII